MRKNIRYIFIAGFFVLAFNFNGCLLDAFDTLTQELPYTYNLNISGDATTLESTATVNLDNNDFYDDNQGKINKIELVKLAYKTKEVNPENLQGNISLTIKQSNGTVIFSKSIPGNQPSLYKTNPFELSLTQQEIQLANTYLSNLSNKQFIITAMVTGMAEGPKTLEAEIFIVFEMDYDL